MPLTAPYFSVYWLDQSESRHIQSLQPLTQFISRYPGQREPAFLEFCRIAREVVAMQLTMKSVKQYLQRGLPLAQLLLDLAYLEIHFRHRLRVRRFFWE